MSESIHPSLSNLKPEVRELMRVSERLIGYAHQNHGSLSNDDCEAILYYVKDLQREIMPYCAVHHQGACPTCLK